MDRVGFYYTDVSLYDDPQTELVFPLSVGVTNADSWMNSSSAFGGYYNFNCVGSGTLMIPGGVFTDVLLVRVKFEETSAYALTQYIWYSSENGAILLKYVIGDGAFVVDQAIYLADLDNKISENDVVENMKYNNPVTEKLQISYHAKENLTYNIFSSTGQIIFSGQLSSASNYSEIDLSNLSKGVYFVKLESEKNKKGYSFKVVKI